MAPGQTINASVGQEFRISMEENPTTGFTWQSAQPPNGLEFVERDFVKAPTAATGAGGTRVFVFRALNQGEFQLNFSLQRGGQSPVDEMTVRVLVT